MDYTDEVECLYKSEMYSVRNNGSVKRHAREDKRIRKDDDIWTFGKLNTRTGYLEIGSKRIHQIVATAFLGEAPTSQHVIVHVDTDKRDNKPDNLRWVTKFENFLLTPYNCEKFRKLYVDSIEKFLENVDIIQDIDLPMNFNWIKTIDQDTATQSHINLLEIAKSVDKEDVQSLDDWLSNRYEIQNRVSIGKYDAIGYNIRKSLTTNAIQIDWVVPSEFPCCPKGIVDDPIVSYFENLAKDSLFCINDRYKRIVLDAAITKDEKIIIVLSKASDNETPIKPWTLAKIKYENPNYVHYNLGSFFTEIGAKKYFCLAQGDEWNGEDSIDDYC